MRKAGFIVGILPLLFFLFLKPVFASKNFSLASQAVYTIDESGDTTVSKTITVTNNTEYLFTPTFIDNTGLSDVSTVKVTNDSGPIPFEIIAEGNGQKSISVTFPKRVVGKNKKNTFAIFYKTTSIAKRLGNIWQIQVPGAYNQEYDSYSIKLFVPKDFGDPAVVKPSKQFLTSRDINNNEFDFDSSILGPDGIFAEFGSAQYYHLKLSYHISNPNFFPISSEIALPPDTPYQRISIKSISPKPSTITQDGDGNWVAHYNLAVHQKMNITAVVVAKISAVPALSPEENASLQNLLSEKQYWETNDSDVKKLAAQLKTPHHIYSYVRDHLTYNYNKVGHDNRRLGAKGVLASPKNAVCLEFTDLFVAIARAAGIPARAIEGYGFTENSKLKPISQVNDILHTWAEYYDARKNRWIMVDPTWGNTSLGSDYFNSLDFEHITFVRHGDDSTYPVPAGGYKFSRNSKDVDVTLASPEDFTGTSNGQLLDTLPQNVLWGIPISAHVTVTNSGSESFRGTKLTVTSDLFSGAETVDVGIVPPYGSRVVPFSLPAPALLTNKNYTVTIVSNGAKLTHTISAGFIPQEELLILGGVGIGGALIIFFITTKTRRLFVQK